VAVAALAAAAHRGVGSVNITVDQIDTGKVEAAIRGEETRTSGEIVVVVASHCDDYIHVPIHIATACALLTPLLLPFLSQFFPWSVLSLRWVFLIQLIVFIFIATTLSIPPLRWWVTPRSMKNKHASRFAAAEFLALELHRTVERTGVLIFVALREHYIEIISDTAVSQQIPDEEWSRIIQRMRPHFVSGQATEALLTGVQLSGEALARHFPPGSTNLNQVSDKVVIVDDEGTRRARRSADWTSEG
jgi:putative membrane protein